MPYPLSFRQNTLCDVYDPSGAGIAFSVPTQLFRPQLMTRFNILPANWAADSPGGATLYRFTLLMPSRGLIVPGPNTWYGGFYKILLQEDFAGFFIYIFDGTGWEAPSLGQELFQGYGCKNNEDQTSTVTLAFAAGPPSHSSPMIEYGTTYNLTVAPSAHFAYQLVLPPGAFASVNIVANDQPTWISFRLYGGSEATPIVEGGPASSGYISTGSAIGAGVPQHYGDRVWFDGVNGSAGLTAHLQFRVVRYASINMQ
jgi:hypothetical protein